ncbi:DUF4249 domain-containing protein [Microvirga sp. STR05]|uniref:DUF4249 domain-containing protein n=1 Tax=Hymenobacter duratus TaxID=2771356 RepID=A0ABR8JKC0_9BACT|nr:DUF4249 domain-containing protein [Hymenobacter duratus]MBD2717285.1 DUF4249 domain-containing protein [Hymenobacter duratus]MBR7952205.1 DUF4249 domain-containing protein [Microvirga sp. STR05]
MSLQQVINRIGLGCLLLFVTGCNLEKDIDVVVPAYTPELVVECYLQAGEIPRLSVVESGAYLPTATGTDQPTITLPTATTPTLGIGINGITIQVPVDVTVRLTLPSGQVVPLVFAPGIDPVTRKVFTHIGTAPLAMQPGQRFELDVRDTRDRHVTGTASVPAFIPIDTVRYEFNGVSGPNRQANILTRWTDPAATADYYYLLLNRVSEPNDDSGDYLLNDQLFNGQTYTAPTTYRFTPGDTITATLYHLEQAHYNFQQSVLGAVSANGNPFAQPARIRSTVQGGLGVFTVLVADRRTVILK